MYSNAMSKYINLNYEYIKMIVSSNGTINEDVFHDTLIKCMDKFNNREEIKNNDFVPYFVKSFKNNMLRNKLYSNNSNIEFYEDIEQISIIDNDCLSEFDIEIILEDIRDKFGKDYNDKFIDWLDNLTISDINRKHNCKNSRYVIDKIRNYIADNYKE